MSQEKTFDFNNTYANDRRGKAKKDPSMRFYYFLASIRILLTLLPQTGYIHPDEFFQSIEVASGESFDIDVYKPWEFNITFPVRSYFFPYMYVTVPYYLLKIFSSLSFSFFGVSLKTPYFLVVFPRLFVTLLSFTSDYCLYKICKMFHQPYIERLTIFASSYVILTYSTRTFSNSLEMILLALLLYYVSRCIHFSNKIVVQSDYLAKKYYKSKPGAERARYYKLWASLPPHSLNDGLIIATITVLGIFNRLTFITYAIPPIFFWLHRGLGSKTVGFLDFHIRMFTFIIFTLPAMLGIILYDSLYFGYLTTGEIAQLDIGINNFVVTPYNFFKYNSVTKNLETHGLHPRFLHLIVNIPLLFNVLGITGIFTVLNMIYRALNCKWLELPRLWEIESLMIACFVLPVTFLSIFPHQEPRFIIPILLPLCFLFANKIKQAEYSSVTLNCNDKDTKNGFNRLKVKNTKVYLKIWYITNILLTIFYGFLHQGGILSLTSHIARELKSKPFLMELHLFTSHSYPIPTGLLQLRNTHKLYRSRADHKYKLPKDFFLYERGTQDPARIYNSIVEKTEECYKNLRKKDRSFRLYYALPSSFFHEFVEYILKNQTHHLNFKIVKKFYPHISIESLPVIGNLNYCFTNNILWQCTKYFIDNLSENALSYFDQFSIMLLKIERIPMQHLTKI